MTDEQVDQALLTWLVRKEKEAFDLSWHLELQLQFTHTRVCGVRYSVCTKLGKET